MISKAFQDPTFSPCQPVFVTLWWVHPDLGQILYSLCKSAWIVCRTSWSLTKRLHVSIGRSPSVHPPTGQFRHICVIVLGVLGWKRGSFLFLIIKFSRQNQNHWRYQNENKYHPEWAGFCLMSFTCAKNAFGFLFCPRTLWCFWNLLLDCTVQAVPSRPDMADHRHRDD